MGSALTNEQITTDYSESLLEFITPALPDPAKVLESLEETHRFVYSKLGDEYLWSPSMPCTLPAEEDIPIAEYGSSNIGKLKHVYRKGGPALRPHHAVHRRYPLQLLAARSAVATAARCRRRQRERPRLPVVGLYRADPQFPPLQLVADVPVRRLASPDKGFLRGRPHQLEELDAETLYLPYATSLRMSDLATRAMPSWPDAVLQQPGQLHRQPAQGGGYALSALR